MTAERQRRRPIRRNGIPGIGIDAYGGGVIDPTENVLSLVDVEKNHAAELRVADNRYHSAMHDAETKYQDGMRESERRHQREVADLKQGYDKQISDILTVQVKTTSELISTQLDKVTTSLSNQINAAATQQAGLINTLSERIGQLERARWEVAGKTSVSDPATSDALARMAGSIANLTSSTAEAMSKTSTVNSEAMSKLASGITALQTHDTQGTSQRMGQGQVVAWIVGAAMFMAALITPLIAFIALHGKP